MQRKDLWSRLFDNVTDVLSVNVWVISDELIYADLKEVSKIFCLNNSIS